VFHLNVLRIFVIFGRVTGFLTFEVDLVHLAIGVENVICAHAQDLRHADEKVEEFAKRVRLLHGRKIEGSTLKLQDSTRDQYLNFQRFDLKLAS
jgi:hypothetical protein